MRSELIGFQETLPLNSEHLFRLVKWKHLGNWLWHLLSSPSCCLCSLERNSLRPSWPAGIWLSTDDTEYGHGGPTPGLFLVSALLVLRWPLTQKLQALLSLFLLENCQLSKELLPTSQFDWKVSLERSSLLMCFLGSQVFCSRPIKNCFM